MFMIFWKGKFLDDFTKSEINSLHSVKHYVAKHWYNDPIPWLAPVGRMKNKHTIEYVDRGIQEMVFLSIHFHLNLMKNLWIMKRSTILKLLKDKRVFIKLCPILALLAFLMISCGSDLTETDKIRGKILKKFSKEMKKNELFVVGGGGGQKNGKINLIEATMDTHNEMNVATGRELIVRSTEVLLAMVNEPHYQNHFTTCPVSINTLHVGIIGPEQAQFKDNYIQFVSLINGMISYDIKSPTPRFPPLITIYEETFEEAQKIVQCQSAPPKE